MKAFLGNVVMVCGVLFLILALVTIAARVIPLLLRLSRRSSTNRSLNPGDTVEGAAKLIDSLSKAPLYLSSAFIGLLCLLVGSAMIGEPILSVDDIQTLFPDGNTLVPTETPTPER